MAEFGARYSAFLVLLCLLLFSGMTLSRANGDVKTPSKEVGTKQGLSLVKRAYRFMGVTRRVSSVKSWAKVAWVSLRSPDSWSRKGGLDENVEWAFGIPGLTKWWDTISTWARSHLPSPVTRHVDADSNSASGTGEVVKEAVKKTKEKVKKTAYPETEL